MLRHNLIPVAPPQYWVLWVTFQYIPREEKTNMTTSIRYPLGRAWVTLECQGVKEAIRALSEYAEVFRETQCGLCQSDQVIPTHRQAKGYDFYEMECLSCGAVLSFGQTKEGGRLFPKRKNADGYEIGKDGWHQYQGTQAEGGPF